MEYRLYNKPYCSIFDLMGGKEPYQTKGLGLVLAESPTAMKALLKLLKLSTLSRKLSLYRWVVECETIASNSKDRADIIIYFYKNNVPQYVIMIEAKSINSSVPSGTIVGQLTNYSKRFPILNLFPKVLLVALSISKNLNKSNVIFLTWDALINALLQIHEPIVENYINYLTRISSKMKYFTHEVISIPASVTYHLISQQNIYVCPATSKQFNARAKEKPQYVAFRQRGGKITELRKIIDIIKLDLSWNRNSYVTQQDQTFLNANSKYIGVVKAIDTWCKDPVHKPLFPSGLSFVYILDTSEKIVLSKAVYDKGKSGKGARNHTFPKLTAILQKSMDKFSNTLCLNDYE